MLDTVAPGISSRPARFILMLLETLLMHIASYKDTLDMFDFKSAAKYFASVIIAYILAAKVTVCSVVTLGFA